MFVVLMLWGNFRLNKTLSYESFVKLRPDASVNTTFLKLITITMYIRRHKYLHKVYVLS